VSGACTASFYFGEQLAFCPDLCKSHRPGTEDWRQIIEEQRPCGLAVAEYCLERGVTLGSDYILKTAVAVVSEANPASQAC
jgi:hypothetical protein